MLEGDIQSVKMATGYFRLQYDVNMYVPVHLASRCSALDESDSACDFNKPNLCTEIKNMSMLLPHTLNSIAPFTLALKPVSKRFTFKPVLAKPHPLYDGH